MFITLLVYVDIFVELNFAVNLIYSNYSLLNCCTLWKFSNDIIFITLNIHRFKLQIIINSKCKKIS